MKALKLSDRDRALILKTSRYYLQYRRANTISKLKSLLDEVEKVNLENAQGTLSSYLSYSATKTINQSIKTALRDMWVKREFVPELGEDTSGVLDVGRTIPFYPFYYYSLLPNIRTDELSTLSWIARRTLKLSEERVEESRHAPFPFFKEMKREMKKLRQNLRFLPSPSPGWVENSSPQWLKDSFLAYTIAKRATAGVRSPGRKVNVKLVLSKLYELFVYMVIVTALERMGLSVRGKEGVVDVDQRGLVILFNVPATKTDLIERVDDLSEDFNRKVMGRPDISIFYDRSDLVLVECKYSDSPGYITEGRFKAMAYTYEFNSKATLLVFPKMKTRKRGSEEEGTLELYRNMGERGWIDIRLRDGRKVYMVKMDPVEQFETLVERVKPIMAELI
ncbi:hypothetical protein GWK48_10000 [Metallosphaera tengchongensis]|uniref:Uncharacterized protein n=1 Tax=Metallosphaera tengchongensis TaxID=1532350 RepID=A0A6N0NUZ2_9CREN|nr:hypothetical protein [Metallosphaera tengchongensis]QKR00674.1 hypothetical protein GWK48_10000 [Metallosphaera tengchongensis]